MATLLFPDPPGRGTSPLRTASLTPQNGKCSLSIASSMPRGGELAYPDLVAVKQVVGPGQNGGARLVQRLHVRVRQGE